MPSVGGSCPGCGTMIQTVAKPVCNNCIETADLGRESLDALYDPESNPKLYERVMAAVQSNAEDPLGEPTRVTDF